MLSAFVHSVLTIEQSAMLKFRVNIQVTADVLAEEFHKL
jgi:hypothetical protein